MKTNLKKQFAIELEELINKYDTILKRSDIIGAIETMKLVYVFEKIENDKELQTFLEE